jgi:GNAT superfamily N-acetyltransferase
MNPTSVSEDRLLVAVAPSPGKDTENGGRGAQQEEEDETVVGFGQIRPLDSSYSELASLYVDPAYRGRGIGTKIVRELLRRHDDAVRARRRGSPAGGPEPPPGGGSVCLLTLQPTAPFYEAHGFRAVSRDSEAFRRMPASVRLEHAAGTALSALLGNQLACMVRDPAE